MRSVHTEASVVAHRLHTNLRRVCAAWGLGSFGAGVCFSLLYLRLLSKSVEGMTGGGGGPSAPSILVPVLLFGIFRRWNDLYAEEFGITAQIVPLLMGFFTYKVSTIIEVTQPHHLSNANVTSALICNGAHLCPSTGGGATDVCDHHEGGRRRRPASRLQRRRSLRLQRWWWIHAERPAHREEVGELVRLTSVSGRFCAMHASVMVVPSQCARAALHAAHGGLGCVCPCLTSLRSARAGERRFWCRCVKHDSCSQGGEGGAQCLLSDSGAHRSGYELPREQADEPVCLNQFSFPEIS